MGIEPTNDGYEPPAFTILAILIVCCWCLSWKCSGLALKTQTVLATRPGVRSLTVLPAATSYKTPLVIITKGLSPFIVRPEAACSISELMLIV